MFKVGDKVVDIRSGYRKDDGSKVTTGVVTKVDVDGDVCVLFDGLGRSYFCYKYEVQLAFVIGKTLTELDVKPGDVVRREGWPDGDGYCVGNIYDIVIDSYHGLSGKNRNSSARTQMDGKGYFSIVSRAPQPTVEPTPPKRMHPDDVAHAMMQYAFDCGYQTEIIKLSSENGSYTYDV